MLYDINELRDKIDSYFAGTLSKKELGVWAGQAYYDILKGSYVENKKIVLYPFLKTISSFHIESNDLEDTYPCSEEDVIEIQKILHGKKDFDFQVEMSIPAQAYNMFSEKPYFDEEKRKIFSELKQDILSYTQHEIRNGSKISEHISAYSENSEEKGTLLELLEEYILRLCRALFNTDSHELNRRYPLKLYPLKTNSDHTMEKLINCLDCYIGDKPFSVVVSYRKGMPDILLLV